MSILIKGMEMPNHGEGVCLIVTNFENCESPVAMLVDRESILPKDFYDVIEVPTPHGRLIDADKFLEWLQEFYPNSVAIMSGVKNAKTIIEAEE